MLVQVVSTFEDEVREIESAFSASPLHQPPGVNWHAMKYQPWDDGCLISLWDAWNRFLRTLYLTCAAGSVQGVSNFRHRPQIVLSEVEALATLKLAGSQKGSGITLASGEPKWFIAASAGPISTTLGLSNGAQIANALAQTNVSLGGSFFTSNPVNEIQTLRNFVAHKSTITAVNLTRKWPPAVPDLSSYMRMATRGGSHRFKDWCDALAGLAWDACV